MHEAFVTCAHGDRVGSAMVVACTENRFEHSSQVFSVTASRVTRIQAVAPDELLLWVESMREIDNPGHAFTRQYDIIEWHGGIEVSRRPVSRREAQRRDGDGQIAAESNRFKVAVSPTTGLGTVVIEPHGSRGFFR